MNQSTKMSTRQKFNYALFTQQNKQYDGSFSYGVISRFEHEFASADELI